MSLCKMDRILIKYLNCYILPRLEEITLVNLVTHNFSNSLKRE